MFGLCLLCASGAVCFVFCDSVCRLSGCWLWSLGLWLVAVGWFALCCGVWCVWYLCFIFVFGWLLFDCVCCLLSVVACYRGLLVNSVDSVVSLLLLFFCVCGV